MRKSQRKSRHGSSGQERLLRQPEEPRGDAGDHRATTTDRNRPRRCRGQVRRGRFTQGPGRDPQRLLQRWRRHHPSRAGRTRRFRTGARIRRGSDQGRPRARLCQPPGATPTGAGGHRGDRRRPRRTCRRARTRPGREALFRQGSRGLPGFVHPHRRRRSSPDPLRDHAAPVEPRSTHARHRTHRGSHGRRLGRRPHCGAPTARPGTFASSNCRNRRHRGTHPPRRAGPGRGRRPSDAGGSAGSRRVPTSSSSRNCSSPSSRCRGSPWARRVPTANASSTT